MTEYIYGVHCGDDNCYACATMRHRCKELELLDNKTDMEMDEMDGGSV
jgi:hypothetical protein